MKKAIMLTTLMTLNIFAFADIPELDIWGMEFAFRGDVRSRMAWFNNYDMNYATPEGDLASDIRTRLELKVTGDSPFYFDMMVELGNIDLDEDLAWRDFIEWELRESYVGYKKDDFKGKAGILDLNTPGSSVYEDDALGLQIKYDFDFMELKTFYSMTNLIDDHLEPVESFDETSHLLFLGLEQEYFCHAGLWGMYYYDPSDNDFTYYSIWTGLELEKEIDDFTAEFEYIYNFGRITSPVVPISAYYTRGKVDYEVNRDFNVYTRLHLTGDSDGDYDTINQFQVVEGEGNLDTGLGLLFGGSAFESQSYFDKESISIVSDNLSSGDAVFNNPGLFIYELGGSYDFKSVLPLDLETELVLGGAHTGDLFEGKGYFDSLIGWEMDIHNSWNIIKDLEFGLSLAYLIPGNVFNGAYELNGGETLELDTSFKTDCLIKYSF